MKILFSPSEAKNAQSPINSSLEDSLCFKELFWKRLEVLEKYQNYLTTASEEKLSKLFGLKQNNQIQEYKNVDILKDFLQLAILRYTGIGYDYLDFSSLEDEPKEVLLNSMIIFSNLFGPILAKDKIPNYKFKQGETIDGFIPFKHYKTYFSKSLDEFLKDDLIIDLRAGFYEKFYSPTLPTISMKFLKNGKSVSHFAKAYRGLAARTLAITNPKNEEEFKQIFIPGLHIKEIQIKKNVTTYIYDIAQ